MLNRLSRSLFLALGRSAHLASWIDGGTAWGPKGFARRFVAGTTVEDALAVARDLNEQGFEYTLNHLGEHVTSRSAAEVASRDYLGVIEATRKSRLPCALSVKLSQIGLEFDREICAEHLRRILGDAAKHGGFVRIDMEGSKTVDDTFAVVDAVWTENLRNIGVVLQAYLHRTDADLRRMLELGVGVRLCKGAYDEPPEISYRKKTDVDAAFVRQMQLLLLEGQRPAIATHDRRMISATCRFAEERGVPRQDFQFEMLYGVRRDLQESLRRSGYSVGIYLPFGSDWYQYFMRRLAERPENALSVARSLFREGRKTR